MFSRTQFPASPGDDEVVGIAYQIDFGGIAPIILSGRLIATEQGLHTVQCHISQHRRYDSTLRGSFIGGEQLLLEYETTFEPFAQQSFYPSGYFG